MLAFEDPPHILNPQKELKIMKARIILAAMMLLGVVAIAGAVPDQPNMEAARANLQTAKK
jgi:hypothetical protein